MATSRATTLQNRSRLPSLPAPGSSDLDTRTKIRPSSDSVGPRAGSVIAKGWFDVLTADHCRALADAKQPDGSLLVLVFKETAAHPTPLDANDRAQLVAGLACVDEVVICDESEADALISKWQAGAAIDIEALVKRDVVKDVIASQRSE